MITCTLNTSQHRQPQKDREGSSERTFLLHVKPNKRNDCPLSRSLIFNSHTATRLRTIMAFRFAADDDDDWSFRDRENCRGLVSNQQNLDAALKCLLAQDAPGVINHDELSQNLTKMQKAISNIDTLLRDVIVAEIYTEQCPAHAKGLAQQVFNVPELLETILVNLTMEELLAAQFINRQFRDAVNGSTRLQRKLSLLPHSSEDFYAPFVENEVPGFYFNSDVAQEAQFVDDRVGRDKSTNSSGSWSCIMQAWFAIDLPKVGSRCRGMLVFQPSVREVAAFPTCCHSRLRHQVIEEVYNEDGITVGDLLDAAASMKERHRQCPYASYQDHDHSTGEVLMRAIFQVEYFFNEGDPREPTMEGNLKFLQEVEAERREFELLEAFANRKQFGKPSTFTRI